jgi:hypothetical protein
MKKLILTVSVIGLALSACAKSPNAIPAVAVASSEYSGRSCSTLNKNYRSVLDKLSAAEKKQRQAQTGDAIGVFLILVPVSSLTGGEAEADVGRYKGEKIAIERAMEKRGC